MKHITSNVVSAILGGILLSVAIHTLPIPTSGRMATSTVCEDVKLPTISVWATDEPSGEIGFVVETSRGDSVYLTESMLEDAKRHEGFTVEYQY